MLPQPVHRNCAGCTCPQPAGTTRDRVAILLCTHAGAPFLRFQLESIGAQHHGNWRIYASDDGSRDQTRAMLFDFRQRHGHEAISFRSGPGRGFVANFLSLASAMDIDEDYFAFCDQDDIWEPDKLSRALECLAQIDPDIPALYCSRTRLIDENGRTIGFSPLFAKAPHFRNAIVQSIAGGNTMVFNAAARRLLIQAGSQVSVPSHDWWLYILVTAMGGIVRYDRHPSVRYRVHSDNAIGANCSFRSRLARIRLLFRGTLRTWTDMHVAALLPMQPDMQPEARRILIEFMNARASRMLRRIMRVCALRIYRQTWAGNIGLLLAVLLRKA